MAMINWYLFLFFLYQVSGEFHTSVSDQCLVGKGGKRRGLHDAHVSFYSFLMIFSLTARKEHLLFVVTQPGLFIDLGCAHCSVAGD